MRGDLFGISRIAYMHWLRLRCLSCIDIRSAKVAGSASRARSVRCPYSMRGVAEISDLSPSRCPARVFSGFGSCKLVGQFAMLCVFPVATLLCRGSPVGTRLRPCIEPWPSPEQGWHTSGDALGPSRQLLELGRRQRRASMLW